jgi:type II secretory pathway pseudopilin PulG
MTLVELLVAMGVGSILFLAVGTLAFYSARSFAALSNYVELDNFSRNALDQMTREIRQADGLVNGNDHFLTFNVTNPTNGSVYNVTFTYDPATRQLTRTQGAQTTTLLKECDFLKFSIYQRNPIGGTYDQYPTANPATCKLVQMSWICSRNILGKKANTESVQSAKVVIRKQ